MARAGEIRKKAENAYKDGKDYMLTGTLNVIPHCRYTSKSIVNCMGLGVYSGLYYIKKAVHTIRNGQYTTTLEVLLEEQRLSSGGAVSEEPKKEPVKLQQDAQQNTPSYDYYFLKGGGELVK